MECCKIGRALAAPGVPAPLPVQPADAHLHERILQFICFQDIRSFSVGNYATGCTVSSELLRWKAYELYSPRSRLVQWFWRFVRSRASLIVVRARADPFVKALFCINS